MNGGNVLGEYPDDLRVDGSLSIDGGKYNTMMNFLLYIILSKVD